MHLPTTQEIVNIAVDGSLLFQLHAPELGPDLPASFLESFTKMITFEVFNEGEWVMHKGMLTMNLSVIARGLAQVLIDEASSIVIAQLRRGDCFGEHSAITGSKCNASVRAK